MKKYRFSLDLQLFNDEVPPVPETGVEEVPAAEEQIESEIPTEDKAEAAFAKKWSDQRKKWEADKEAEIQAIKDQYKDHDVYKKAAEYLQKSSGISDMMTLKEEIELQELQERAEESNIPPEMQKRLEELEAKASKADELEAQRTQEQQAMEFESNLKSFCEGKEIDGEPLDHKELWNYMAEHGVGNTEIAFKAMKADLLEAKLADAKKDAVTDYLNSKKGVKAEGSGAAVNQIETGGGFKGAEARAIARLKARKQAE